MAANIAAEPNQMALATASASGAPSVRMVLLKGYDERGFVFYSNHDSRKGREMAANGNAALCMYWEPLQRQVCSPWDRFGRAWSTLHVTVGARV